MVSEFLRQILDGIGHVWKCLDEIAHFVTNLLPSPHHPDEKTFNA